MQIVSNKPHKASFFEEQMLFKALNPLASWGINLDFAVEASGPRGRERERVDAASTAELRINWGSREAATNATHATKNRANDWFFR
jgi:hypothetical protein